jgi:CheY-like chemotaxis protein
VVYALQCVSHAKTRQSIPRHRPRSKVPKRRNERQRTLRRRSAESRYLIAELLYEYEVDFALTADDAVQLAHGRSYDLCFVDPSVPGSGGDVLDELRLYDPRTPLIICGGAGDGAANHNASAWLQKPLCPP